jgi:hypothetical protein
MHVMKRLTSRAGYSVVELLIACVVGVLVLSSAMTLAVSTFRSMAGMQLRDGIDRNSRYVGMSLQRDLTETGVLIDALAGFGTLVVRNDSIAILRVAFDTSAFPQYNLTATGGFARGVNAVAAPTQLDILSNGTPRLAVGDLARYQLATTRRLIYVTGVRQVSATVQRVTFTSATRLLFHPAGLVGAVPILGREGDAFIQKLQPVMYWRNGTQLMRAQNLNADGTWNGVVISDGLTAFDASLIFTDGGEFTAADTADADATNDLNDISGIRIRATIRSETTDARVNAGAFINRDFEWFVAPRNLIYERNRI